MSKVLIRCDRCGRVTGWAETPAKFYPGTNVPSKYESVDHKTVTWMGEDGKFKHVCAGCYSVIAWARRLVNWSEGKGDGNYVDFTEHVGKLPVMYPCEVCGKETDGKNCVTGSGLPPRYYCSEKCENEGYDRKICREARMGLERLFG